MSDAAKRDREPVDGLISRTGEAVEPWERAADRFWEWNESAAQVDDLLSRIGDLAVTRDLEGRILFANEAFARLCGQTLPVGRTLEDLGLVPQADGADKTGKVLVARSGTQQHCYDWHDVIQRNARTGERVIHSLGRDVTARKQAEDTLIAARERAETASEAKSRFLAMVSHEVRTPLNGILGIAELLARTRLTHEQESYVAAVRQSGHALLSLIGDLLDFSSMEAGRFHLRPEAGNLRDLVGGVVELSALKADEKGIEIASYVAPDVPETLTADHGRLRQVLFNLIGNALKFTEHGGVFVEVVRRADALVFSVCDTGPGLDEADHERIFLEFEQIESGPTRQHDGAGLGLAISARLIAAMGGTIAADNDPDGGSIFSVRLPLESPGTEENAESASCLSDTRLLLVAPPGPTATALLRAVRDLGGKAETGHDPESVRKALARLSHSRLSHDRSPLSDIVVDNRLAGTVDAMLAGLAVSDDAPPVRRTMMVTPAERADLTTAGARAYSAWLIRPLRMTSLIKVLRRRTGGLGAWLEEREEPAGLHGRAASHGPESGETLSVLLAEDNPVNALLVRAALERAGHRVVHVTNGRDLVEQAYDRASKNSVFDIVLSDLAMPVMDGGSAIATIRRFERDNATRHLPILVLSADGQDRTRRAALENGADDYIEKPIDPSVLLEAVAKAVGVQSASA